MGPFLGTCEFSGGQPGLGSLQCTPSTEQPKALCPAQGSAVCPCTKSWWPPDRCIVPTQTLYKQTSEALDQMLQTFIMQNPTADELQFLLSVRWGWAGQGRAQAGLGQRVSTGRCPKGDKA